MLEVRDVTAGYGDANVLWNIDMTCPTGSVVALLGPNGAGKTTLLRTISGMLKPTSGKVLIDGQDLTGQRTNRVARRGICHIPEGRGIFAALSVRENLLLFSPQGRSAIHDSLEMAIESFPILGQRLSQTAGSLSGGEQQMLALARAYLSSPKVVLVDEASMGLAPLIVDGLFDFLERVSKQGSTLIIVEQYVHRVLELADTVFLLNQGKIVFSGPTGSLSGQDILENYLGVGV